MMVQGRAIAIFSPLPLAGRGRGWGDRERKPYLLLNTFPELDSELCSPKS